MDQNPRQRFGAKIRALREERGCGSLEQFAELTGLTISYLHYLERGKVLPGEVNMSRLKERLDLSIDDAAEVLALLETARRWQEPKPPYPGGHN